MGDEHGTDPMAPHHAAAAGGSTSTSAVSSVVTPSAVVSTGGPVSHQLEPEPELTSSGSKVGAVMIGAVMMEAKGLTGVTTDGWCNWCDLFWVQGRSVLTAIWVDLS
jgi:hypothetical protein